MPWFAIPALLILIFYSPILLKRVLFLWDTYDYSFPLALYLRDSLSADIFPFWNPFILSGEAFFAQPPVTAYHPIHLILAIAPDAFNSLYLLQVLLVLLPLVGAYGFFKFIKGLGISEFGAIFAATSYGLTFFGPLLGQLSIAFGIALFPWLMIAAIQLLESERVNWKKIGIACITGSVFLYGTYFGVVLYAICILSVLLLYRGYLIRKKLSVSTLLNLSVALILTGMLFAPHLLATIENRNYYYSNISSDFVSPDPRVRGVTLPKDHVVEIIPNERTLLGVLINSRELSSDGAFWVIGPGYAVLFLSLMSFAFIRRKKSLWLVWASLVIGISYVLGPKSIVFDFVFKWIPLLNNIRYPVFAFPFVVIGFVILAAATFDQLLKNRSNRVKVAALIAVCLETFVFSVSSGLFHDRIPDIARSVSTAEYSRFSLDDRERSVFYRENNRVLVSDSELRFRDKDWISKKLPTNHGYSTSDSPFYWYLKSAPFLEKIAYCPTESRAPSLTMKLSNAEMRIAGEEVRSLGAFGVLSSRSAAHAQKCLVENISVSPNRIELSYTAAEPTQIVLANKNYPGWEAKLDGIVVPIASANYLFSSIEAPAGTHSVTFEFRPKSFLTGCILALTALVIILVGFVSDSLKNSHRDFSR